MASVICFPYVERNCERDRLRDMQRLVLAAVIAAILAGLIVFLVRSARRLAADGVARVEREPGSAMQRVAFVLLLCLIVYVSFSGAS